MAASITLDALNAMSPKAFGEALGPIFEHAPAIAAAAAAKRPFATVEALHRAMFGVVEAMPEAEQRRLVGNHPELAGREAETGTMTAESVSEQGGAGLNRLSAAEAAELRRLNAAYRERFDLPFLVCVRRHTRRSIFREASRRLTRTPAEELDQALQEIFYVTRLRIVDRVEGPGVPVTTGRLSTHVLDTVAGRPAAGVAVELREFVTDDAPVLIRTARTNAEGRLDQPLLSGEPLRIGTYEISFDVGMYFAQAGYPVAAEPFLSVVPIRFGIAEPETHYHVPLTVTPWSYSTYRGS